MYPGVRTFTDIEEATHAGFDGYIVATPPKTHAQIGRYLLSKGCPTLIEKPMALTSEDASALTDLAALNNVNVMVGHLLLFHPAIRKMKALIDGGDLGKLHYVYSNRLNLGTVRTDENILWSFAPHDIALFQYLIGGSPTEVLSSGAAYLQPHVHDTTMTVMRYPENVVAHVFVSWLHPFKEHRLVAIGSKGMITFEDSSPAKELKFYQSGVDVVNGIPVTRNSPHSVLQYEDSKPLEEELRYFIDHLPNIPLEFCRGEDGIVVLQILEAASESLASGKAIRGKKELKTANAVHVHPTSIVDEGATVGPRTKIWHFSHVQEGAQIGADCVLGQNVNISNNVQIGNNVKIQNNVSIYEGVILEDNVFCGPSCVFTNVKTPRAAFPRRGSSFYETTRVKHGATIGANATIICGNTLGEFCLIGAGAVVTKDIPAHAIVTGNPARQTGWACECGAEVKNSGETLNCVSCMRTYRLENNQLLK